MSDTRSLSRARLEARTGKEPEPESTDLGGTAATGTCPICDAIVYLQVEGVTHVPTFSGTCRCGSPSIVRINYE